jgi:hypothetical protein
VWTSSTRVLEAHPRHLTLAHAGPFLASTHESYLLLCLVPWRSHDTKIPATRLRLSQIGASAFPSRMLPPPSRAPRFGHWYPARAPPSRTKMQVARTSRLRSNSALAGVVHKEVELVVLLCADIVKGGPSLSCNSGRPQLLLTQAITGGALHVLLLPRTSLASYIFLDLSASSSHVVASAGARCCQGIVALLPAVHGGAAMA